ncbi:ABC transporter permease subunit [Clostridium sp. P21]|uniref:ABC transporter permease subunit n=1 Tax=Clostridium muellerianum TaxID=2716538 RepID=A0A7Y0EFG2_9CLOT|nr:ABC transporter permease [Clostridium muellerianum]NMM62495.1 ABC transporter permease subunit [Clostridium muellerianum]
MLNIIYSEFLKLKKSYISSIALIAGIVMSILMIIGNLVIGISMPFEKFACNIEQMNLVILNPVLFSLIAGYIFSREFTDKTASILYSYPISRMKLLISKLITIYALIFLVYSIQCISVGLSYYIANGIVPSYASIINYIKANIVSMLFQFLLIPIPILIGNITKNIIMPTVYGILSFITAGFIGMNFTYADYIPLMAPYISTQYFYFNKDINLNHIIFSTVFCFIIFMPICIYEFNKKEID